MTKYEEAIEEVRRLLPGDQVLWAQDGGMRAARILHLIPLGKSPGLTVIVGDSMRELVSDEEWRGHIEKFVKAGPGSIPAAIIFGVTVGLIASDPKASGFEDGPEEEQADGQET